MLDALRSRAEIRTHACSLHQEFPYSHRHLSPKFVMFNAWARGSADVGFLSFPAMIKWGPGLISNERDSNLFLSSSIEDGLHERVLGFLFLLLLLVLVEQRGRLDHQPELDQAEEEEADAGHQPHFDRRQRLSLKGRTKSSLTHFSRQATVVSPIETHSFNNSLNWFGTSRLTGKLFSTPSVITC